MFLIKRKPQIPANSMFMIYDDVRIEKLLVLPKKSTMMLNAALKEACSITA